MAINAKGGTESSKRYTFVGFRQRVESIKIDPVRNLRRKVTDAEDQVSYFLTSFNHHVELNLSVSFTEFAKLCGPLCQSFPQLLHHQKTIFNSFEEHINRREEHAIESLLDLLTHFAHDLGPDFMPYFPRAVALISSVAASSEINLIEAAFNSLAYLFKYLSRLLTPDLRSTYDLVAPLFGRDSHVKPFIARFAAEALSFLIRRTSSNGLDIIMKHIIRDVVEQKNTVYSGTVATLFADAIKSTGTTMHSKTGLILHALYDASFTETKTIGTVSTLVENTLIPVLHHVRSDSSTVIYEESFKAIEKFVIAEDDKDAQKVFLASRILITIVGHRKGSRVNNWPTAVDNSVKVIDAADLAIADAEVKTSVSWSVLVLGATVLQTAPLSSVTSKHTFILNKALIINNGTLFLPFVELLITLSKEVFSSFALPFVQKYLDNNWKGNEEAVGIILHKLYQKGALKSGSIEVNSIKLSESSPFITAIIQDIQDALENIKIDVDSLVELWWKLETISITVKPSPRTVEIFVKLANVILQVNDDRSARLRASIASKVLTLLTQQGDIESQQVSEILNTIEAKMDVYRESTDLLESYLAILRFIHSSSCINLDIKTNQQVQNLASILVLNLTSPSNDVRSLTIQILQAIFRFNNLLEPALLAECLAIATIPLDISTARNIALNIRNIGKAYILTGSDPVTDVALIRFLFGLLTVRFQPVWEATEIALVKAAERTDCQQLIWELSFEWLKRTESNEFPFIDVADLEETAISTAECSNLRSIVNHGHASFQKFNHSHDSLVRLVIERTTDTKLPEFVRSHAIKVLKLLPRLAEKHTRDLVPFLLWEDEEAEEENDEEEDERELKPRGPKAQVWTIKDRTGLLELFSQFVNPRMYYRNEDVYERFLYLLGNKQVAIQRVALKCLLTWKDPSVRKYGDNLNNLLDETRFRDEVTNILQPYGEEVVIHDEDRENVLPFVIRILFGRFQTSNKSGGVKQGRKFATLSALPNVEGKYVDLFVSLATERLNCRGYLTLNNDGITYSIDENKNVKEYSDTVLRRLLGFVNMLEDLINQLGKSLVNAMDTILEALLFALATSQAAIEHGDAEDNSITLKAAHKIRQMGFKALDSLFKEITAFTSWNSYFDIIYKYLISPRLEKFAAENLQQPSAILKLFITLSTRPDISEFLATDDCSIIKALTGCLYNDSVKDAVIEQIMDFSLNLLELGTNEKMNKDTSETLIDTNVSLILPRMPHLFEQGTNSALLEKEASLLCRLSSEGFVLDNELRFQLIDVSIACLQKPQHQVKVSIKVSVLKTLSTLLEDLQCTDEELITVYKTLSTLFKQFRDRLSRENLAKSFVVIGSRVECIAEVCKLIDDLNSYSKKRFEEPDFNRRLAAFGSINEQMYSQFTELQWLPVIYNVLYFIKDPEELALRTHSAYTLRRFCEATSAAESPEAAAPLLAHMRKIIMPALKLGIREKNDSIRFEFVSVLAHLVRHCENTEEIQDMKCLLFGGDEEANFFNNVNHIQKHRRQRAVRRLGLLASKGKLRDTSIAHYLLPVIEHFVADADGDAHNLSAETIKTVGILVRHTTWNQYSAITKRYVAGLRTGIDRIKVTTRLIDSVSEALMKPEDEDAETSEMEVETTDIVKSEDIEAAAEESKINAIKNTAYDPVEGAVRLIDNIPSQDKVNKFIIDDIIPPLSKTLKARDEDTLNDRIPLSIPLVKFIRILPESILELKLPGVLTGLCQIMRAKSQELRDMMRKTLGHIARILGAQYLLFLIRELRGALRRGTQLHILGYTVHSILVELGDTFEHGDLDPCARMIAEIIMEDTFGVTGSEKDAEGYNSKMREVKQHKSYDSGELLAKNINLSFFKELIEPVKSILLYERLNLKIEKKVEELLRRFAMGLYRNEEASNRDTLVMCYELYQQVQNIEEAKKRSEEMARAKYELNEPDHEGHFIINLNAKGQNNFGLHAQNLHILVRFVFDTVRAVLGKAENLLTAENVVGFVPLLDDGLKDNHEDVQIAALRMLAFIIKLPIPGMDDKLINLGRQTLSLIKSCPSTNTELCQASLKFLSTLIRHKDTFKMKDTALGYVLLRLKPDLEELDRQGVAFTFIKAVLSRNIIIPEVYEVMDRVAEVMVTNPTKSTRDMCRSVYFQFLTEYPQGRGRLTKQFTFLISNLQYPTPNGRISVMEVVHLLLMKVGDELVQDIATSFFVALVLVLVNDDNSDCRQMSATLIRKILNRITEEPLRFIEKYLYSWLEQGEQPILTRGALQVVGIYVSELDTKNSKMIELSKKRINTILKNSKSDSDVEVDWELVYFSLQLWFKIVEASTSGAFAEDCSSIWVGVEDCLLFPHSWVRLASSRLMGLLYNARDSSDFKLQDLIIPEKLQYTAYKFARQLGAPRIAEELGLQVVKNLVFIAMTWEKFNTIFQKKKSEEEEEEEEEDEEDDDADEQPKSKDLAAVDWIVQRISSVLRNEKYAKEMVVSKRTSIQFLASVVQIVSADRLIDDLAEPLVMAFYNYVNLPSHQVETDLKDMADEALNMIQTKIGTTEYLHAYNNVKMIITERRIERKQKRARQAISQPDVHARRKIRKNVKKREGRRHVKDDNGYYQAKKARMG
ncbi:hypothetical protein NADFUDRAFT_44383 [Nadsonia fulvescens var. elongata DSM 6958]|uniref:Uncharacterized protein n=1 Tax=Nadsonia fulvescens var. elongata DSM 6958 TaxID=857566 RepID=A0A1E3PCT4_9ASCO|nr:hypothetical protein NADFUDRAFT_44383 [Nadsonia fulvescens var. elongata DSM 6958]